MLLNKTIGCNWYHGEIPWCTKSRLLLVVQYHPNCGWFFTWTTRYEFPKIDCPEWTAKSLIKSYESLNK